MQGFVRNAQNIEPDPRCGSRLSAVQHSCPQSKPFGEAVREGAFYGWPYSYYGQHVDDRVQPPRPDLVATAVVPDYALGSHTGSLGLTFANGGAVVGQHGSWNRRPRSGYKVIFIPFANGKPSGTASDILTDFVDANGNARGRPVGVVVDGRGALFVADDVGNVVWRVTRQ